MVEQKADMTVALMVEMKGPLMVDETVVTMG